MTNHNIGIATNPNIGKLVLLNDYRNDKRKIKKVSMKYRNVGNTRGASKPLTDPNDIQRIMSYFLNHINTTGRQSYGRRNCALFVFGLNTAKRMGDILTLRVGDVFYPNGEFKSSISIGEQKTNKTGAFLINNAMRKSILNYLEADRPDYLNELNQPLFKSNKTDKYGNPIPIAIQTACQIMKDAREDLGFTDKITTHSCRKTFARKIIDSNPNNPMALAQVQQMLNHSSTKDTLRYVGIEQEDLFALYEKYQFCPKELE